MSCVACDLQHRHSVHYRHSIFPTRVIVAGLWAISALFTNINAQQAASATLSGTIKDPNGGVIAGARITGTQKGTGVARSTTSNQEGLFVLTNLSTDEYEIRIQATGFAERTALVNLQVGQNATLNSTLSIGSLKIDEKIVENTVSGVSTESSVVDGLVSQREIENLPLNGRNFLELALLIPGNSPAPNFDPTKTNTVVISSAGQLGRGGNVTVDGADDNDDVVGGQLQNISQEAVQEFQIATNRFSAQLGRSGSAVINVVTKSGTNEYHGSASIYFRDKKLQALPATFNRGLGQTPPFDREQYAFALGGPIKRNRAWFFGSFEYRNQDGAALVGARDLATRTINRTFAAAPLNDLLSTERADWQLTDRDRLSFRYSLQREDDVAASTLDRAIGSASQRQASTNNTHFFLANYTRVLSSRDVNSFNFSFSTFFNDIEPVTAGPQLTFPSIQDGASFRVPQGTKQRRLQFSDAFTMVRGNHTAPLLIPNADSFYYSAFVQDDWRLRPRCILNFGLRYELDTDVKNIKRYNELNPIILPLLHGSRTRDKNNFGPRVGFNYSARDERTSIHGGYGIYYDRITLEIQSLERGLDGRALPIEVRAGPVFFIAPQSLFDPINGKFPPGAPTLVNPFSGFILTGAGAAGINIIDNSVQNPLVQQTNVGFQRQFAGEYVLRADYLHNFGTHFIIGRTIGSVFNPVVGGP